MSVNNNDSTLDISPSSACLMHIGLLLLSMFVSLVLFPQLTLYSSLYLLGRYLSFLPTKVYWSPLSSCTHLVSILRIDKGTSLFLFTIMFQPSPCSLSVAISWKGFCLIIIKTSMFFKLSKYIPGLCFSNIPYENHLAFLYLLNILTSSVSYWDAKKFRLPKQFIDLLNLFQYVIRVIELFKLFAHPPVNVYFPSFRSLSDSFKMSKRKIENDLFALLIVWKHARCYWHTFRGRPSIQIL